MRALALLFPMLSACATAVAYRLPMTAGEAASYGTGDAVVAYLKQDGAAPAICDLNANGPHLQAFTPEVTGALVGALLDGQTEPGLWRRCTNALLKSLPPAGASQLLDALAPAYRKLISSGAIETDPQTAARLAALQRLYLERNSGLEGTPQNAGKMFDALREVLARKGLGPVATRFGQELLMSADVERGLWEGKSVDTKLMDALAAAGNEMTLRRFAARLPSSALREEAKRRIIRVHIALSPFAEVREHSAEVEATVLRDGDYAVSLDQHPVTRASLAHTPPREVVVEQNLWPQSARLVASAVGRKAASVMPVLSMRGLVSAELKGISRPVGVCGKAKDLEVAPCIAPADVSVDNPFAYLDGSATFHFRDHVRIADLVALAGEAAFRVPVKLKGVEVAALSWGLKFEKPENLLLTGMFPAGNGPTVTVNVDHRNPARYVFDASAGHQHYFAIVEAGDVASFRAGSEGAQGYRGGAGADGADGAAGSECQDGAPGADGGPGGPGGPGGNGGEVRAVLTCGPGGACDDAMAVLQSVVVSLGGPGGRGGAGGAGGAGGQGGPSRASTSTTDSSGNPVDNADGCNAGGLGPSGSDGPPGRIGPDGLAGHVTFETARGVL